MLEPWITIAALLVILGYGRLGATFGLFCELPNALMLLIAMLVSLRYWYPASQLLGSLVQQPAGLTAVIAFWALLVIACCPMIFLLRHVTEDSRPVYPKLLNGGLGFGLGLVSATLFFSCLLLSGSIFLPKIWPAYDRTTMYLPWDNLPVEIYQHIERGWLGISADDPGHTRFPTFEKAGDSEPVWR